MRSAARLWRRSIRVRVVVSTLVLSSLVILLTGWALLHNVASGLADNRRNAAIAEARVGFDQAQAQLDASAPAEPAAQSRTLTQLVDTQAATRSENRLYEMVLEGPLTPDRQDSPVRTSGGLIASQIPESLAEQVRQSPGTYWQYTDLELLGQSGNVPSIIVGRRLNVPNSEESYGLFYVFSMAEQQQTLNLVTGALLIGGLVMVAMVGAVAWLISRQVVDPLRRATRIAERYASGQLEQRIHVRGEDDIARLSTSFNQMAESLQNQIRRLENLSMLQQRFVSDVSHELRTPLTTIQMASEVIHQDRAGFDTHTARAAELLQNELGRFADLLSDLLDLSRFDAGAAQLELDTIDFAQIAITATQDQLLASHGMTARARGIGEPAVVEADIRRVDRIVRNLLANAAKYSQSKRIEIVVAQNDSCVSLSVRDFGIGMSAEESRRVFDRFWRGDPARPQGGTGLGLAIAREDAILHGGTLEVWSRPKLGSEFVVTLPKSGAAVESAAIRSVYQ